MNAIELISHIPWIGVGLATVISMMLGGLWYGPLFGKPWMKLAGIHPKNIDRSKAKKAMLATAGTSFVENSTFGVLLALTGITSAFGGSAIGLFIGIGMISMQMTSTMFFEQKPVTLWRINSSYRVAALTINGAVLGAFL